MLQYAVIIILFFFSNNIHTDTTPWVDSCYGVKCLGYVDEPTARKDWGWSSEYCIHQIEETADLIITLIPPCYV